jgi:hypothetical protein
MSAGCAVADSEKRCDLCGGDAGQAGGSAGAAPGQSRSGTHQPQAGRRSSPRCSGRCRRAARTRRCARRGTPRPPGPPRMTVAVPATVPSTSCAVEWKWWKGKAPSTQAPSQRCARTAPCTPRPDRRLRRPGREHRQPRVREAASVLEPVSLRWVIAACIEVFCSTIGRGRGCGRARRRRRCRRRDTSGPAPGAVGTSDSRRFATRIDL